MLTTITALMAESPASLRENPHLMAEFVAKARALGITDTRIAGHLGISRQWLHEKFGAKKRAGTPTGDQPEIDQPEAADNPTNIIVPASATLGATAQGGN